MSLQIVFSIINVAQWLSMMLCKGIAGVFLQPHTVSGLKHHRRQDEMISAVFNSFKRTPVFLHSWLCSHILFYCMTKDCRRLYVSKESAHFSICGSVIHIWSHHLLQTLQFLTILCYYNNPFFVLLSPVIDWLEYNKFTSASVLLEGWTLLSLPWRQALKSSWTWAGCQTSA